MVSLCRGGRTRKRCGRTRTSAGSWPMSSASIHRRLCSGFRSGSCCTIPHFGPRAPGSPSRPLLRSGTRTRACGHSARPTPSTSSAGRSCVARLVGALAAGANLVALVGPSGSGESSILSAGLIPALRGGACRIQSLGHRPMRPGGRPSKPSRRRSSPLPQIRPRLAGAARGGRHRPGEGGAAHRARRRRARAVHRPARGGLPDRRGRRGGTVPAGLATAAATATSACALSSPFAPTSTTVRCCLRVRPDLPASVINVAPMTAGQLEAAWSSRRGGSASRWTRLCWPSWCPPRSTDQRAPAAPAHACRSVRSQDGGELGLAAYRAIERPPRVLSRRAEDVYRGSTRTDDRPPDSVPRLVRLGEGRRDAGRRVPVRELTSLGVDPVVLSDVLRLLRGRSTAHVRPRSCHRRRHGRGRPRGPPLRVRPSGGMDRSPSRRPPPP